MDFCQPNTSMRRPLVFLRSATFMDHCEIHIFARLAPSPCGGQGYKRGNASRIGLVMIRAAITATLSLLILNACGEAQEEAAVEPGAAFQDCEGCPEMVVLPAGSFMMGSPPGEAEGLGEAANLASREFPRHEVTFAKPFAIGRFEITRDQWAAFVKDSGYFAPRPCRTLKAPEEQKPGDPWRKRIAYLNEATWDHPGFEQTGRDPVACVSWEDAKVYTEWLSEKTGHIYRMPSEAEWEYAARAGSETPRPFPTEEEQLCTYMNGGDQTFMEQPSG